jgi:uncharacterized protein (TIGR03118 family)
LQKSGRGGSAAKQFPPQPGTIPALGLRAGVMAVSLYRRPALERRSIMWFSSWLRNGRRSAPAALWRTRTSPRQPASFRPRLEALEVRLTPSTGYVQTNLTANPMPDPQQNYQPSQARFTDNNLNGWGMTSMPNGTFVVANAFSNGTATFYTHSGNALPLAITVPVEATVSGVLGIDTSHGHPTGVVYNPTSDFKISENGKCAPATLIFDTLDGIICGWNPDVDRTHAIVLYDSYVDNNHTPAVYTSLDIGQSGGQNVLFATDFFNNQLDIIGPDQDRISHRLTNLNRIGVAGQGVSTDTNSSVWSVSDVNGELIVTFADLFGPVKGGGAVDVYNTDGVLKYQIDANDPDSNAAGRLQNPWGVTVAPANFGTYSNDLLVGNVWGPGHINAYQPDSNGNYTIYAGQLSQPNGTPIAIKGLWDMEFDDGLHLFFDAGPNHPGDSFGGLFGVIHVTGDQDGHDRGDPIGVLGQGSGAALGGVLAQPLTSPSPAPAAGTPCASASGSSQAAPLASTPSGPGLEVPDYWVRDQAFADLDGTPSLALAPTADPGGANCC